MGDQKLAYLKGFLVGGAATYGALILLGFAPVWFGPEFWRWAQPLEENPKAKKRLTELKERGDLWLWRVQPSTRNFLKPDDRKVTKVLFLGKNCLEGVIHFGPDVEGPPRHVHGGCSAAVVDAIMGVLVHHVSIIPCLTGKLTVNYRKKIPLGSSVGVSAWLANQDGRKITIGYQLFRLVDENEDKNVRDVFVEGEGLFVQVYHNVF